MSEAFHVDYLTPGDAVRVSGFDDICCVVEYAPQQVGQTQVYIEWDFGCGKVVEISDIVWINNVDVTERGVKHAAKVAMKQLCRK